MMIVFGGQALVHENTSRNKQQSDYLVGVYCIMLSKHNARVFKTLFIPGSDSRNT